MNNFIASFSDLGTVRYTLKTPRQGIWGYVLHDWDLYGMSRPEYKEWESGKPNPAFGLPETERLYNATRVSLYKPLLQFWFDTYVSWSKDMGIDELKQKFNALLSNGKAYTDHAQGNTANYINDPNSTKPPIGFNPIITGGNVVEILEDRMYRFGGELWYKIRVLDVRKPIAPQLQYHVIGHATNSTRALDGRQVDPFPQLNGRPVPVPYFSYGDNYFPAKRIRILDSYDDFPNPYYPPR